MKRNNQELEDGLLHCVDRCFGIIKRGKNAQGEIYQRGDLLSYRAEKKMLRILALRMGYEITFDD